MYESSVSAWEKAVAVCLASENNATNDSQRQEYQDKLRDATAALNAYNPKQHSLSKVIVPEHGALPWQKAAAMIPDLKRRLPQSAKSSVRRFEGCHC